MRTLAIGITCFLFTFFVTAQETQDFEPTLIDESSEEVPFFAVEEVPIFEECEEKASDVMRDCFQKQMQQHIAKNFRYPEAAQKKKVQGRVAIFFVINEEGILEDIRTEGPDPILEQEALRIFQLLPQLKPGKHHGDVVRVPYSIPITFKLQ